MKAAGFAFLFTGWLIVLAAMALLRTGGPLRASFALAGVAVEGLGLLLAVRGHLSERGSAE